MYPTLDSTYKPYDPSNHYNGPSAPPADPYSVPLYQDPPPPPYQAVDPYPQPGQLYYLPPQRPMLTGDIHAQTSGLLYRANEIVRSILGDSAPLPSAPSLHSRSNLRAADRPADRNFGREGNTNVFAPIIYAPSTTTTYVPPRVVHHHHHRREENQDDSGSRALIGVIGLIVAGVAAFFIGKAMAEGEESEEQIGNFDDLKGRWNANKNCYDAHYQHQVEQIIVKSDLLLERKESNRKQNVALVIATFATGTIAFVGALIASEALMVGSLILGAAIGAAALYKLGYALFSTRDQKVALAIKSVIAQLPQPTIYA